MKRDIILAGVGGQGILSIATIIGEAATKAELQLKQAEVHGMSQRGGDVQSNLRLSHTTIYSDLIPRGKADMIIATEPMEALRYLDWLGDGGVIVTNSRPFVNIPNYPDDIMEQLEALGHSGKNIKVIQNDIEALAREHMIPKSANVILLGMAAPYLNIIKADELREAVGKVFASKGNAVVEANLVAFDLGMGINLL